MIPNKSATFANTIFISIVLNKISVTNIRSVYEKNAQTWMTLDVLRYDIEHIMM